MFAKIARRSDKPRWLIHNNVMVSSDGYRMVSAPIDQDGDFYIYLSPASGGSSKGFSVKADTDLSELESEEAMDGDKYVQHLYLLSNLMAKETKPICKVSARSLSGAIRALKDKNITITASADGMLEFEDSNTKVEVGTKGLKPKARLSAPLTKSLLSDMMTWAKQNGIAEIYMHAGDNATGQYKGAVIFSGIKSLDVKKHDAYYLVTSNY